MEDKKLTALLYVEIPFLKGELLFRAIVPAGITWQDAHKGMEELTLMIADHIKSAQDKEKESSEDQELVR